MSSGTPIADGGFWHKCHKHAVTFGHFLEQNTQKNKAVGHAQNIRVMKIQLKLRVCTLRHNIV